MTDRKQITPVLAPDIGLVTGTPKLALPDRAWAAVQNGRFRVGKADKVPGFEKVNTVALNGPIMGIYDYNKTTGFQAWIFTTKTKIYKMEATDSVPVDITGAVTLSAGDEDWSDFTTFNDTLIVVNGKDAPIKWTGTGDAALLGGSPPIARRVANFQSHVMMGHIVSGTSTDTQKVQWSDLGLPETWTGGEAGSLILRDEPSTILEIMPLRDSLIAYKEDAGYVIDYTGFPFTMQTRRLFTGVGPIAPRIVVDVRDAHYFVAGDRQVYKTTLSGPEPVGEAVRFGILDELNHQRKARSFVALSEADNELYFVIPTPGNEFPNLAYILGYVEHKWGRRDLGSGSSATGTSAASAKSVKSLTSLRWDDITSSWDAQTITWDGAATSASSNILLHGTRDGFVMKHSAGLPNADGAAIDWQIDSKMFDFGDPARKKRVQRLHLYYEAAAGTTLNVYVLTTDAPGVTPTVNGPFTIVLDGSGDQWVDLNLTAKYFQFRFKNAALSQPVTLTGYTPIYYIREES